MIDLRLMAAHALGLALANADAHVHETGGANRGYEVEFWQHLGSGEPPESWCQYFAYAMQCKAWCQTRSLLTGKTDHDNRLIMLAHADEFSRETHIPRTGSCQDSADAAKKQGRFHGRDFMPSPGDQVYYDLRGQGVTHHTGLVLEATSTRIHSVEGNTSAAGSGSQDNGDGVYQHWRGRAVVYGFAHFEKAA